MSMARAFIFFIILGIFQFVSGQDIIIYGEGEVVHEDSIYNPTMVLAVDYDEDGDLDIIMNRSIPILTDFYVGIVICENEGNGSFRVEDEVTPMNLSYPSTRQMLTGDLDEDGLIDILVFTGNLGNPTPVLIWYKQVAVGDFELHQMVSLDESVDLINLVDFDFDGDLDVMATDWTSDAIFWNQNNGSGDFSLHDTIYLPETFQSTFLDIDEDGDMDILNARYGKIYYHENPGDNSTFNSTIVHDETWGSLIEVVDLDTNGLADLLIRKNSDDVAALYGQGNGEFQISNWTLPIQLSQFVLVNDMNDDGLQDIFARNYGSDQLIWYENRQLDFDIVEHVAYSRQFLHLDSPHFGDLDGDDAPDLYAIDNYLPVWFGLAEEGNLSDPETITGSTGSTAPLEIVDLDQNAGPDIIMAQYVATNYYEQYEMSWYQNGGEGQLGDELDLRLNTDLNGSEFFPSIPFIDYDGDLDPDILTVLFDTSNAETMGYSHLYLQENDGLGGFETQIDLGLIGPEFHLGVGDIDDDNDDDILILHSYYNDTIHPVDAWPEGLIWLENSNGQFNSSHFVEEQDVIGPVDIADVDNDGDMDLIVNDDWGNYSGVGSTGVLLYQNDGDQNFEMEVINHDVIFGIPTEIYFKTLKDMDRDGDLDLVCLAYSTMLVVMENTGPGLTWITHVVDLLEGGNISPYVLADVNMDAYPDILWLNTFNGELLYHANKGNLNFRLSQRILRVPLGLQQVHFADMDDDGLGDIIAGPDLKGRTLLFRNRVSSPKVIRSHVFYDYDQNGVKDSIDFGIENQVVQISPGEQLILTDELGYAFFIGDLTEEYHVSWQEEDGWSLTSDSSSYSVTLPDDTITIYQFAIFPNEVIHEVVPHITGFQTNCVQSSIYFLSYTNTGTVAENGMVELIYDPILTLNATLPFADLILGDTLRWEFENLLPGSSEDIAIQFATIGPVGWLDSLSLAANVYLEDQSSSITDTFSTTYSTIILCSSDPNDKQVQPPGIGEEMLTLWGETLVYTVRFQNVGNFPAFNVVILDTIDANLDLSTLRIIHHSHPMQTMIDVVSREVEFFFPDIQLPDSISDPLESNGFVTYSIEAQEGIEVETVVHNTAHIIFDLNEGISTNTTTNTLVEAIGNEIPTAVIDIGEEQWKAGVFPNPWKERAFFILEGASSLQYDLILVDLNGRVVASWNNRTDRITALETVGLPDGIYFLKIIKAHTDQVIGTLKLIKQ